MKCANHPLVDSVAFCGQCGRPLCGDCKHDVRGMSYCENCLAVRLQGPGLPPLYGPSGGPNPGVALGLGFIPGVGAIYNGQIVKAIIQVMIFASLIAMSDRAERMGPLFGLGAAAFYFYMVIDSYQTAKRKQLGQPAEEWFGLGELKMNVPLGAALLIGVGALLQLDYLGIPILRHVGKFWPALLIVVGLLMLQRRFSRRGPVPPPSAPPPGSEPPGAPKEGPTDFPGPLSM